MTIDLHALAEALRYTNNALDQVGQPDYSLTDLVRDIRQNMKQAATALAKLQTQHEAERNFEESAMAREERMAAVAEALEATILIIRELIEDAQDEDDGVPLDTLESAMIERIRALKLRSDMVCVPREPTKGTIDEADVLRYEKAMRAAAKEGE